MKLLLVLSMLSAGCVRPVHPEIAQCPTVKQMSASSFDVVAARAAYCACPTSRHVAEHLCSVVPSLEERIRAEARQD